MNARRLTELRRDVDVLDERIVELLAARFVLTETIGRLKAEQGEAPRDPARQRARAELLSALSARHGLPADLVTGVFALISGVVVARHRAIASIGDPPVVPAAPDAGRQATPSSSPPFVHSTLHGP